MSENELKEILESLKTFIENGDTSGIENVSKNLKSLSEEKFEKLTENLSPNEVAFLQYIKGADSFTFEDIEEEVSPDSINNVTENVETFNDETIINETPSYFGKNSAETTYHGTPSDTKETQSAEKTQNQQSFNNENNAPPEPEYYDNNILGCYDNNIPPEYDAPPEYYSNNIPPEYDAPPEYYDKNIPPEYDVPLEYYGNNISPEYNAPPSEHNFAERAKNPAPKDNDIMIYSDMLQEVSPRRLYTVKEDFIDEVLKKAFSRLDLPAIEYINGSDVLIEAGGNTPADLIVKKPDGAEVKVPLGENEQNTLDDSVAEFEQSKGRDKQ